MIHRKVMGPLAPEQSDFLCRVSPPDRLEESAPVGRETRENGKENGHTNIRNKS